tara:strand:+ start:407 stop:826 length:420 start_codon:yes stop_codon:yes gene_type:complete
MVEYKKNFFNLDLDWQTYIDNLNDSANRGEEIKFSQVGFYVTHSALRIKELQPLFDKIKPIHAHLYLSLSNLDETFEPHEDFMDVWFWQAIGKTHWKTYETEQGSEFLLEPGDLIYIPRGIKHKVKSLTPRVGISMANE